MTNANKTSFKASIFNFFLKITFLINQILLTSVKFHGRYFSSIIFFRLATQINLIKNNNFKDNA